MFGYIVDGETGIMTKDDGFFVSVVGQLLLKRRREAYG